MALSAGQYQRLDATALAQLIRNGDVSAAEVLETCISLVEQHNQEMAGMARESQREAARALVQGGE